MHLIKLNATESTNDYLKNLASQETLPDFTAVVAKSQTKGKGQMGAKWSSEEGKNLILSVLKNNLSLFPTDSYSLNICASLAIYDSLSAIGVPDLKIKWPNDILSGSYKICGILIENQLRESQIKSAIIGIGLNVNQTNFPNLQNAASLKMLLGKSYDIEELLTLILKKLQILFDLSANKGMARLWKRYENVLFRKDKPSTFESKEGELFMGFIRGVSSDGSLIVELEDQIIQNFGLKEIKLLY